MKRRLQQTNFHSSRGMADGGLVHTNPSDGQKAAGNYAKAPINIHGMRIKIEQPAGSVRKGTDPEGNKWSQPMAHDYGYIRGMTGKDKDKLDVFLGPDADDPDAPVHVIDQNKKGTDDFDEHKVMMGFQTPDDAVLAYHRNYEPGWDGFRGVTSMPMREFRQWGAEGKTGKRKPAADYTRFKQDSAIAFAEGGHVQASQAPQASHVTLSDLDQSLEDMKALQPYFGTPKVKRDPSKNNNKAAADMVLSGARGVVAGTAGLPGDLEGLGRQMLNARSPYPTPGLGGPVVDLIKKLVGPVGTDSALPTSDFYNQWLPGRIEGPQQRFAEGVGNLAGMDPLQAAKLARPAARIAERGMGVLGQAAEQLYGKAEPLINRAVDSTMSQGGKPAQLLQDLALGTQSNAVKPKGGNWEDSGVRRAVSDLTDGLHPGNPISLWLNKRIPDYITKQMGTASDPLLKLEQQGRLHFAPDDMAARAGDHSIMGQEGWRVGGEVPGLNAQSKFTPMNDEFHQQATGRNYSTPWEALTDSSVVPETARRTRMYYKDTPPDWLNNLPNDSTVYQLDNHQFQSLGFDHVKDYLKDAIGAGAFKKNMLGHPFEADFRTALGPTADQHDKLIARNLQIDEADLPKMSLSDVISKSSDWNNMIMKAQSLENMNKGVKSVLKQYPETGHQWVELAPEGLEAEGNAMRHCVGGYCSDVSNGNTRILSLRQKDGKPMATVELSAPRNMRELMEQQPWTERNLKEGIDPDDSLQVPYNLHDRVNAERKGGGDYDSYAMKLAQDLGIDIPWNISQIKGPANRAPSQDVQGYVQDFVKNMGPWGPDIKDLQNTGLINIKADLQSTRGIPGVSGSPDSALADFPGDYGTHEDILNHLRSKGWTQSNSGNLIPPTDGMARGGRVGFAAGGTVVGTPTVGLATFGNGQQSQGGQSAADAAIQAQGTMTGGGGSGGSTGGISPGSGVNMSLLPSNPVQGAPTYDLSTPYGQMALGQSINSMGAGDIKWGVNAFLPPDWQPYKTNNVNGETGMVTGDFTEENNKNAKSLADLAQRFGVDTTGYDLNDWGNSGINTPSAARWDPLFDPQGFHAADPNAPKNLNTLFTNMNNDLKDYRMVKGASAGWDGKQDPRGTGTALYKVNGNVWNPVSAPTFGHQAENPGWIRGDGADMIQALSMVMPAFGGWAGLLGSGTAGTLSAGAGLGLTTGLPSALVNAGAGALLGGGYGALAGGLGSYAGGALGQAYGQLGQQVGQQLGGQAGKYLYNSTRNS